MRICNSHKDSGYVDEDVGRMLVVLMQILPVHAAKWVELYKMLNLAALKEGAEPIGPDYKLKPVFLTRALMSALLDRKAFDGA